MCIVVYPKSRAQSQGPTSNDNNHTNTQPRAE